MLTLHALIYTITTGLYTAAVAPSACRTFGRICVTAASTVITNLSQTGSDYDFYRAKHVRASAILL